MSVQVQKAPRVATTTAGLRGVAWKPERVPKDVTITVHPLRTEDGAQVTGYLFRRGGEKTVVCAMHPRELSVPQYLVPEVLFGGCAMWVQGARSPGNDIRLEHETALLDLAAGQRFLREQCGFEKTVLQGTSGGGPLAAFYCQQSGRKGDERIKRSPAGRPTQLDTATLPVPDGVILVSSHLGQGRLLMNCVDPAVVDENDPLQTDEALSAFNAANGWKRPPESSSYAADFLVRYRAAQRARVERIDAFAKALVERKAQARKRSKETPNRADAVLTAYSPIFTVWRTDADPRCFDLSLEPSERAYGTLWGANPIASNYGSVGFARVCTPESWLSNWSGLSSNASMEACAPGITQPTLMIEYTGDNSVFPTEADAIFGWIGSPAKTRHKVHGNHHGQPIRDDAPNGQLEAGARIRDWLAANKFA
ncbi:MAG TPA: hypothetical protein VG986_10495 [Pseudolabrys sp.]|nr:hypothetical protein [Pseudolabrys sp.]